MFRWTRPSGRPRSTVLNRLVLGAVLACASAAFAAQGASAAPCTPPGCLAFNNAVLDAGGTAANIVTPATAPLTVSPSTFNPVNGTYTVAPSGVSFPPYSFSLSGVSGTITTTLANTAHGTLNPATGVLTLAADLKADVHLNGVTGDCTLDTGTVNLSTANTQPLMGVTFPGSTGYGRFFAGAGAFSGTWPSVTASPSGGEACTLLAVGGLTGAGGIWVSRNLAPPAPSVKVGRLKAVKAGKTEAVHVKVSNAGGVGTGAVTLCLKVPRHFKVNHKCQTVTDVAAGKTDVVTFKVKTPKPKHKTETKTYKLKLTPSTTTEALMKNKGLAPQVIRLKVKA